MASRALFLTLVLASLSCGDAPPVEERTVAGFVTDADDMGGIEGADVTFVGDTLYTASTTTGGDGFYELRVETDSPFGQVRASHPEFQPAEAAVFFDTEERRVDLVLRR